MSNLTETRKKGIKTLGAIAIIGISIYLGFTPLFNLVGEGVAGRVVGATFGSIFAILMTMYLLNKQTEIEQESKKSERVFDEKVKLYQNILELTKNIIEDRQISSEDMVSLPFTMINLQMLGGDEAIQNYIFVFEKINEIYESSEEDVVPIPDEDQIQIFAKLSEFAVQCRMDLGISDRLIGEDVFRRSVAALEQSSESVQAKRDHSKFVFKGKKYAKGRLVHAVVEDYVSENPNITLEQLEGVFPKEVAKQKLGVFVLAEVAKEIVESSGRARHFTKNPITLTNSTIMVSSQWGARNIFSFLEHCETLGIKIKKS